MLGRTGGAYSTSGWVIRISKDQVAGQPCVYDVLLQGIEPYAGLGAAPNSNLLYATGSNSVLTLKINTDGTLSTAGQLSVPGFTGPGDITAGPGGTGARRAEGDGRGSQGAGGWAATACARSQAREETAVEWRESVRGARSEGGGAGTRARWWPLARRRGPSPAPGPPERLPILTHALSGVAPSTLGGTFSPGPRARTRRTPHPNPHSLPSRTPLPPYSSPLSLPPVYAISEDGKTAYQVTVDANYLPTGIVTPPEASTRSTYPAAFCTSSGALGVSSIGPIGQVADFTSGSGTFDKVGLSGQNQASGLSGAAVEPVCSTVPAG